jgi:hypothetical protein
MNIINIVKGLAVIVIFASFSAFTAYANSDRGGGPGEGKQGPPPEAIKACEGKREGDIVSFSGRRGGSLKATCQKIEGQLVAVPEGHRR